MHNLNFKLSSLVYAWLYNTIVNIFLGFSSYDFYDVFNFGKAQGGSLSINRVGSWDIDPGYNLNMNLNCYKYYRRWNFQELPIKMIAVVSNFIDTFAI